MGFLNSDKLIVGYDLGNEYCQISYALSETGEAETLSQVAGGQEYNIPAVLCKRRGVNQWLYGREALRCADTEDGILVKDLLFHAQDGEPVIIDGESFDPVALLALFFKRSLGLLSQVSPKITDILVTCPTLDRRILAVLGQVVEGVRLKAEKVLFQSHAESFYSYMLRQPKELWAHPSVLFEYGKNVINVMRLEANRRTTPVVVFVREETYEFPAGSLSAPGETDPGRLQEADAAFLKIAEKVCGETGAGSAFLIGEGFSEEWMKDSLRFLCRGRRVFQGSNLFSKGACSGMQERLAPGEIGRFHVFLGNDKLKANIGMKVLRQGEESYCAVLDAGMNWYEAEYGMEFYVQDGNELELTITPLVRSAVSGEGSRLVRVILEGLPEGATRLRLRFFLPEENLLCVEAQDLGFGEFRESSGRTWRENIEIYQR